MPTSMIFATPLKPTVATAKPMINVFILISNRKDTKCTTPTTNPVESFTVTAARFGHHHAHILLRIVSNSNIFVFNLLNPHLINFTFLPVCVIVEDLIHLCFSTLIHVSYHGLRHLQKYSDHFYNWHMLYLKCHTFMLEASDKT